MLKWLDLPPVWMLGAAALMITLADNAPLLEFSLHGATAFGAAWFVLGIIVTTWAAITLKRHRTTIIPHQAPAALATDGPFAHTRNPIYLADILMLVGLATWLGAATPWLVIPAFFWVLTQRFVKPEERRLKSAFPEEFEAYAAKSPRWL